MTNNLAPIGLSVYSRLHHLQQTVLSLQKNDLAAESELFIFSDAPKTGDEEKVEAVRRYLPTIDGFKKIHIFERTENNRVANNRGGIRMLLNKYGKLIFLEEDSVTSPFFLKFMNDALNTFENDKRIFAVTGYSLPLPIPVDYDKELILTCRMFAWGFGIWADRYNDIKFQITMKDYWRTRLNVRRSRAYCQAGDKMLQQLRRVASGKVEALDIRIDYTTFSNGTYILAPRYSMLKSIGLDGSGEHWKTATDKYETQLGSHPVIMTADLLADGRIIRASALFHMMLPHERLRLLAEDLGVLKLFRFVRKFI